MKVIALFVCVICLCFPELGSAQEALPSPASKQIAVHVSGAVKHMGKYSIPTGSGVLEALKAAGGTVDFANRISVLRRDSKGHRTPFTNFRVSEVNRDTFKDIILLDDDLVSVSEARGPIRF